MLLCDNQISEGFKRSQYFNFEKNFLENENLVLKTGVPLFSWNDEDWNHNIAIQNCSVRS